MKKKILALILCLALSLIPLLSVSVYADAGYTYDEATDTYTVTTADGFIAVANEMNGVDAEAKNLDANILLANDIDMKGKTFPIIAPNGSGYFSGVFDGDGHTISNLVIESTSDRVGIVGQSQGCTFKDLTVVDSSTKGKNYTALFIGDARGGTADETVVFDNCHADNVIVESTVSYATVFVTANKNSVEIKNCSVNNTTVRANGSHSGFFVCDRGECKTITVENCVASGEMFGATTNAGLVGYACDTTITLTNVASFVKTFDAANAASVIANAKRSNVNMTNVLSFEAPIALSDALGEKAENNIVVNNAFAISTADAKIFKSVDINGTYATSLTVNGVASENTAAAYAAATIPAVNIEGAKAKIAEIFASNEAIKTAALAGLGELFALNIVAGGAQLPIGANAESANTSVRLVLTLTSADVESLSNVGAYVSLAADAKATGVKKTTSSVYTSINADNVQVDAATGTYFVLVEVSDIPNASFGTSIYVTPFVTTAEGEVLGAEMSFSVTGLIG